MANLARSAHNRLARRGLERGPVREFLAFALAGELYGVELTRIREIVSPPPLTDVPRAPPDIIGVCSVRGLLVTVIDLRLRFGLESVPTSRRSRILLTESEDGEVVGLLVDEVKQVMRLTESEMELATSVLGGDVSEHVLGIGRPGQSVIILLNLTSLVGG
jgi:purine-binding chemotaxis protein CheW